MICETLQFVKKSIDDGLGSILTAGHWSARMATGPRGFFLLTGTKDEDEGTEHGTTPGLLPRFFFLNPLTPDSIFDPAPDLTALGRAFGRLDRVGTAATWARSPPSRGADAAN